MPKNAQIHFTFTKKSKQISKERSQLSPQISFPESPHSQSHRSIKSPLTSRFWIRRCVYAHVGHHLIARHVDKFREVTPLGSKVIVANTLNF